MDDRSGFDPGLPRVQYRPRVSRRRGSRRRSAPARLLRRVRGPEQYRLGGGEHDAVAGAEILLARSHVAQATRFRDAAPRQRPRALPHPRRRPDGAGDGAGRRRSGEPFRQGDPLASRAHLPGRADPIGLPHASQADQRHRRDALAPAVHHDVHQRHSVHAVPGERTRGGRQDPAGRARSSPPQAAGLVAQLSCRRYGPGHHGVLRAAGRSLPRGALRARGHGARGVARGQRGASRSRPVGRRQRYRRGRGTQRQRQAADEVRHAQRAGAQGAAQAREKGRDEVHDAGPDVQRLRPHRAQQVRASMSTMRGKRKRCSPGRRTGPGREWAARATTAS